jgi:tetratricopeptide (TPR) repeat protein
MPESAQMSVIGKPQPRVDGPLKVSGQAMYASDHHFPGMLYAVPVEATIASGRVTKLDTAAAEKMPGVRAIFHRENIGKIFRSVQGEGFEGIIDERRPPFEDDIIRYYGQYIALAVADTFESAKAAADTVRATYTKEKHNVDPELKADDEPDVVPTSFVPTKRLESERGDPESAFASAPVKLDQTYVTPTETHNPIELQAATAIWDGSKLTIYEESQGIFNLQGILAQMFGLPKENVRVITKFVGSGFGSKLWPWTHCALAVAAARQLGKPVKLVLSRKMMFQSVGHRPRTQQRVRLGATPDGKLVSLQHDYVNHHAILDNYHEDCGEATAFQYSVPNLRVKFGRARRNVGSPTPMRGPGAVPGLYATESALTGEEQLKWLNRIGADIDNLRLAFAWFTETGEADGMLRLATALWRALWLRGSLSEGRRWLNTAVAHETAGHGSLELEALRAAAFLAKWQGDYDDETSLAERALVLARASSDEPGLAATLLSAGQAAVSRSDFERAELLLEESLARARELGHERAIFLALSSLATLSRTTGQLARARALFEESLPLIRSVGDRYGTAVCLFGLAFVAIEERRAEDASPLLAEALALAVELDYREGIAYFLEGAAAVAAARGDAEQAATLLGQMAALHAELGFTPQTDDQRLNARTADTARAILGDRPFETALRAGEQMTCEATIAYASEGLASRVAPI